MKNVSFTDEAYAKLRAMKKKNQSFSDVVNENVSYNVDIKRFLGSGKGDIDFKKVIAEIQLERRRR